MTAESIKSGLTAGFVASAVLGILMIIKSRLGILPDLDPIHDIVAEAGDYVKWFVEHIFVLVPAQAIVAQHIQSFKDFPPRQKPGTFSVERALEKLTQQEGNN